MKSNAQNDRFINVAVVVGLAIIFIWFGVVSSIGQVVDEDLDPSTVPAVAEKTFDTPVIVRTSYVSTAGEYGRLAARVRLGRLISVAEGYELHPDVSKSASVQIPNVKTEAVRSPRFKDAYQEWMAVLVLEAKEQYYLAKNAESDEDDDSARNAKIAAIRVDLGITE